MNAAGKAGRPTLVLCAEERRRSRAAVIEAQSAMPPCTNVDPTKVLMVAASYCQRGGGAGTARQNGPIRNVADKAGNAASPAAQAGALDLVKSCR
jgi:hypothetical protein